MELRHETKWIICMWDIRGDDVMETAKLLKMTLKDVKTTIAECKENGFYDKVRRHIEYFDMVNAKHGFGAFRFNLTKGGDDNANKRKLHKNIQKRGNKNSKRAVL